ASSESPVPSARMASAASSGLPRPSRIGGRGGLGGGGIAASRPGSAPETGGQASIALATGHNPSHAVTTATPVSDACLGNHDRPLIWNGEGLRGTSGAFVARAREG